MSKYPHKVELTFACDSVHDAIELYFMGAQQAHIKWDGLDNVIAQNIQTGQETYLFSFEKLADAVAFKLLFYGQDYMDLYNLPF